MISRTRATVGEVEGTRTTTPSFDTFDRNLFERVYMRQKSSRSIPELAKDGEHPLAMAIALS
jgi:hypothetical protein